MAIKLEELGKGTGFLKMGAYGNASSGKTHTATLVAIGLKRHLKHKGRIWYFDTEAGSEYVNPMIREAFKENALAVKSRVFSDVLEFIAEAEKEGAIAVIDSVTHLWNEVKDSYLKQVNEKRAREHKSLKTRIEFQDLDNIKNRWQPFTEMYVNSRTHIILCGRAGNIWDWQENEETGKKELIKTGTKMKTEAEMGYEPSLLLHMEHAQDMEGGKLKRVYRRATVMKDRFRVLDGEQFENPTFESFLPHIKLLTPGASNAVDVERRTEHKVDSEGDADWQKEKRQRAIYCEEVQGMLTQQWPGRSAGETKAKVDVLEAVFGTRSWTAVESMKSADLKSGLARMAGAIKDYAGKLEGAAKEIVDKFSKGGKPGKVGAK